MDQYGGFWGKSFGQAYYWFKEQRRAGSVALNSYLTYITLPWHWIIGGTVHFIFHITEFVGEIVFEGIEIYNLFAL